MYNGELVRIGDGEKHIILVAADGDGFRYPTEEGVSSRYFFREFAFQPGSMLRVDDR